MISNRGRCGGRNAFLCSGLTVTHSSRFLPVGRRLRQRGRRGKVATSARRGFIRPIFFKLLNAALRSIEIGLHLALFLRHLRGLGERRLEPVDAASEPLALRDDGAGRLLLPGQLGRQLTGQRTGMGRRVTHDGYRWSQRHADWLIRAKVPTRGSFHAVERVSLVHDATVGGIDVAVDRVCLDVLGVAHALNAVAGQCGSRNITWQRRHDDRLMGGRAAGYHQR